MRHTGCRVRAGAGLALAGMAALAASCSSGPSTSGTTSTTTTPTTTPASTSTTSASTTSTSRATTTTSRSTTTTTGGSGTASRCTTAQLHVSTIGGDAAAGNVSAIIGFVNAGSSACTLNGYPGVAALNAQGQQVAQAQRVPSGMLGGLHNGSTTPPVVTLGAGQTASAVVEGSDVPSGTATSCASYPSFLVTPPAETHSVTVAASTGGSGSSQGFPGCAPITVNPVVPGTSGNLG